MFQETLYNSLRLRLTSDPLRLTEELIEQPALMQSAAEAAADALQLRDAAKGGLALATARASIALRVAGEDGKLPSEGKLLSLIALDPEVISATEELEELKHDATYWTALVDSFQEKGSSLRRVADLTVSGYLTPNAAYADRRAEMARERVPLKQRGSVS